MTALKPLAAAALLSVVAATPAFTQAAIQEPGAFAFYHPNADVLNAGAPASAYASIPSAAGNAHAAMEGFGASVHMRGGFGDGMGHMGGEYARHRFTPGHAPGCYYPSEAPKAPPWPPFCS